MSTDKWFRPSSKAGFSLIEILVSCMILGIIAWLGSSYFGRAQKQASQLQAQNHAVKTKQSVADLLKRDLAYIVDPADVVITSLHDITIKRTKVMPGNNRPDLSQTYQVRYRAVCAPIPASLQTQLNGLNFASLSAPLQKRSSCAKNATLQCGTGTYPQLRIEPDAGANIPIYPETVFPDLTRLPSIRQSSLGMLPCFQRAGNQITVGLDVFHGKETKDLSLDVTGERYYLVLGNVSDSIILQK